MIPRSFERMYGRWWPVVWAAAFDVLEDGADTEDIAQVVFARLWRRGSWRSIRRPEPYFREAGRREARCMLRRRTGHAPRVELSSRVAAAIRSPNPTPDVELARAERERLAATLVSRLPRAVGRRPRWSTWRG